MSPKVLLSRLPVDPYIVAIVERAAFGPPFSFVGLCDSPLSLRGN